MADEVWPSQHKVGDQMSPDYVPLKSKQSPTFRIISLRLPSWKLEPSQNLTTAGLPRLGFMCLVENVTCVLLIGFCEAIKQYSKDSKHTALCWNSKKAIYHRSHQRLIIGLRRMRGRCFSSSWCHPCWPWSGILKLAAFLWQHASPIRRQRPPFKNKLYYKTSLPGKPGDENLC